MSGRSADVLVVGAGTMGSMALWRLARRGVTKANLASAAAFVAEGLAGLGTRPVRAAVCMYTNTPDEDFVVGSLVAPGVTVLGGFSGHGFKFAPVMGEIAADLALEGRTVHAIEGFSPRRFSTGP